MTAQARTGTAPEALRDLAERGAAQAKENLETMSAAAGQATDSLKQNYTNVRLGLPVMLLLRGDDSQCGKSGLRRQRAEGIPGAKGCHR